jgi:hypothetical protein
MKNVKNLRLPEIYSRTGRSTAPLFAAMTPLDHVRPLVKVSQK